MPVVFNAGNRSSSYISNKNKGISQHMEYMPFGELLVDEHLNSYNSPFKFNEDQANIKQPVAVFSEGARWRAGIDDETGNYYCGARYYNPKTSIWLSVDPLADDYPGWSPYNYCIQNPVILTDPTGMGVENEYKYDLKTGDKTLISTKGGDDYDYIYWYNDGVLARVFEGPVIKTTEYVQTGCEIERTFTIRDDFKLITVINKATSGALPDPTAEIVYGSIICDGLGKLLSFGLEALGVYFLYKLLKTRTFYPFKNRRVVIKKMNFLFELKVSNAISCQEHTYIHASLRNGVIATTNIRALVCSNKKQLYAANAL